MKTRLQYEYNAESWHLLIDLEAFEPVEPGWFERTRRPFRELPAAEKFQPPLLDTDQWLCTAAEAGARYAVLTAKHSTGFCLWPTDAYDYSVKTSSWRDGKADIVADFVASCRRYGIMPGLYYSTGANGFLNVEAYKLVDGSAMGRDDHNKIVLRQLEELFTNYGELYEIWFDGGVLPVDKGGPDVLDVVTRLQPDAVVFDGPPNHPHLVRWSGSEQGVAEVDCWSTTDYMTTKCKPKGNPDGRVWAPVEVDIPAREIQRAFLNGWMWHEAEDHLVYDAEYLFARYLTSVGRNSNLLIGCGPDSRGLIPDTDAAALKRFGALVRERFGNPLAETAGRGQELVVSLPQISDVDRVVIMEDQTEGQKVRQWVLEASWVPDWGEGWFELAKGCSIGRKRIVSLERLRVHKLRLRVVESVGEPVIRSLKVYGKPC